MDKKTIELAREKVDERCKQYREQLMLRYNHDTEIRYSQLPLN